MEAQLEWSSCLSADKCCVCSNQQGSVKQVLHECGVNTSKDLHQELFSLSAALMGSLLSPEIREREDPALGVGVLAHARAAVPSSGALWGGLASCSVLPRPSACSFCRNRTAQGTVTVSDSSECGLCSHCCTPLLCLCLGQGPTHGVGTGFLSSWGGLAKLSWGQGLWVVRLKAKTHKQRIPVFWCRLVTITS